MRMSTTPTFARWQTFKNSKRCYDNLQTFPLIDDKNMVTAVIDWLDEYGDAEAIEAELDHTLWVMSLWTFKLNQVKNEINKPEEEVRNTDVQLFQELLFCGLEAMVPMYGVGEPGATGRLKGLFGTEPIAAVFTSSLTQEQIEAKMNLIICKIEGEAAKSGSSGPMQQPRRRRPRKRPHLLPCSQRSFVGTQLLVKFLGSRPSRVASQALSIFWPHMAALVYVPQMSCAPWSGDCD